VILVDTSAWVEYLRGTGSPTSVRVRGYRDLTDELSITDVVVMELLAGADSPGAEQRVEAIAAGLPMLPVERVDYVEAAALFRRCRSGGETVRKLDDCLIAAVAIRNDVPVWHNDRDFDVLARHTPLLVA